MDGESMVGETTVEMLAQTPCLIMALGYKSVPRPESQGKNLKDPLLVF